MTDLILFIHWSGKTFLGYYLCYFLLCLILLLLLKGLQKKKWSRGIEDSTPLSNEHLAMLAGGPTRVAQLTLLQLLEQEIIGVSKKGFGSVRASLLDSTYQGTNPCEQKLLSQLIEKKKRGISFSKLISSITSLTNHTEEQLAVRGLSATKDDLKFLKHKLGFLVILFFLPGITRVILGLQRNEDILGAVVLTVLGTLFLRGFSKANPLTSRGKKALKETREDLLKSTNRKLSDHDFLSFAVLGWTEIADTALANKIGTDSCSYFESHAATKHDPPSGGCGGDSGCGGGCGGCGGCGD
ncbi:MAG: TIGR04222 domain-containing membrane protein [Roseibacillus sp.]